MDKTNIFSYINVMDKAADASWLRDQAIANNIANVNTPGYKRQDVTFESELRHALSHVGDRTMDAKVYNMDLDEAAECADLVKAKHNIPYHMVDADSASLFDRGRAEQFDVDNRLIIEEGQEIDLER